MINSVRVRITLLITLSLATLLGFGSLSVSAFLKYTFVNEEISNSQWLVEQVEVLDSKNIEAVQAWEAKITPEHRKEGLSAILKSYESGSALPSKISFFAKNEITYREYLRPMIGYLKKRMTYYGAICLLATLLSLAGLYYLVIKSVFNPLKDLSQKMEDFLEDKYTYQFSVPSPNEVGKVQATFNSMAQRVLSNMDELKSLDKAKSDFLSIASHELRTPLTSIKGSLSLLDSGVAGELNEPTVNLVNIAEQETDRLIRLINDLLDLAKIEAGRFPLEKQWYSLDDLISKTFKSINGLAQSAEVKLNTEEVPQIDIEADHDRIQQVLTNLLSNAIKYSPKKKTVTVNCKINDENHLVVEVTDQGKGIDPEDQALIFEQFRQATGPANPLVKGTGLGLAIAKALVDQHGGEIGVHSVPRKGCTFYFTLPDWRSTEKRKKEEFPAGAKAA